MSDEKRRDLNERESSKDASRKRASRKSRSDQNDEEVKDNENDEVRASTSSASNRIDLQSDDFDPLAALYADSQNDDFDRCEGLVFQSLSQCESYFKREEKRAEKKAAENEVSSDLKIRVLQVMGIGHLSALKSLLEALSNLQKRECRSVCLSLSSSIRWRSGVKPEHTSMLSLPLHVIQALSQ